MRQHGLTGGWPAYCMLVLSGLMLLAAGCQTDPKPKSFSWEGGQREERISETIPQPPTAKTLYAMVRILTAQGKDNEAQYVLGRLIGEHPEFLPAYVELGELYTRNGQIDAAIDVLALGIASHPDDAVLLNNLGMCYVLQRQYDVALARFREASRVAPQDLRVQGNIAMCLGMTGHYDEALERYCAMMPPDDAYDNLALLSTVRGDINDAERFRREAKKIRGRNEN